jgi:hypothetical protein
VIGFIWLLYNSWLHFINNYHTQTSLLSDVYTSRSLVAASKGGCSPSSVFPSRPLPQLPASHRSSSHRLNPNSPLTHSLINQLLHFASFNWTRSSPLYSLCIPGTDHTENTAILLLCACMLRSLTSNVRCLQSHYLATGLHATIRWRAVPKNLYNIKIVIFF